MIKNYNSEKRNQVRRLLFVIGSGMFMAILFSTLLLYRYNPTGQVALKNVLLAPEILLGLNFNDKNSKTGGMSRFVFDQIQFEYRDLKTGEQKKEAISINQYRQFYDLIQGSQNVDPVLQEIKNDFDKGYSAKLKILVRTESSSSWQALEKDFQEVEFSARGNYFRVQLRQSSSGIKKDFAYFYRESILPKVIELFSPLPIEDS